MNIHFEEHHLHDGQKINWKLILETFLGEPNSVLRPSYDISFKFTGRALSDADMNIPDVVTLDDLKYKVINPQRSSVDTKTVFLTLQEA